MTREDCFTKKCPAWIKFNEFDKTVYVDGSYTLNEQSAGMYMYLLTFRETATNTIVY